MAYAILVPSCSTPRGKGSRFWRETPQFQLTGRFGASSCEVLFDCLVGTLSATPHRLMVEACRNSHRRRLR